MAQKNGVNFRSQSDHDLLVQILDRVSAVEASVKAHALIDNDVHDMVKGMLNKHDRALFGVDGRNGLSTRVSGLELRWKITAGFFIAGFPVMAAAAYHLFI